MKHWLRFGRSSPKKPNDAYLLFLQAEILNQKGVDAGDCGISNRHGLGEESGVVATWSRSCS
jgi:hypothetical protein